MRNISIDKPNRVFLIDGEKSSVGWTEELDLLMQAPILVCRRELIQSFVDAMKEKHRLELNETVRFRLLLDRNV